MPSSNSGGQAAQPAANELLITREFDAPREKVFQAWTDGEWLNRWFAPETFSALGCKADPRVGGEFRFCMRSPDGTDYWGKGVYREILAPEKIVYTDMFTDKDGREVEPSFYGMSEGHPRETTVMVLFERFASGTKLTLRHALPAGFAEREGMKQGWNQMLDKLERVLAEEESESPL